MADFPLRSIVVVGGGNTGWLAAATLARIIGDSCPVRVITLPDDLAVNGAIASVPSLHGMLRLLRIDEAALMRATGATFRLGAMFRDWSAIGDRYFNGYGAFGATLDAVPFQHHWLRQAATRDCKGFEEFSMSAHLARLDRFALPQSDPRSVLSLYSYAWHFDSGLLAAFLREYALKAGVVETVGDVSTVSLDSTDGNIREIVLTDSSRVAGDLFIDCSGARAVLGSAVGSVNEDWSTWLPCDRLQTLRSGPANRLSPYSETVADTAGWHSSIPLQHCTVKAHMYCSELTSDAAIESKMAAAHGGVSHEPRVQRLVRGRPKEFWLRNCLLMPGETIDPLDGTALHLAQSGITRFVAHFPVGLSSPTDVAEYNRLTADEYDRLRDLLVLHYHATRRSDSEFWNRCREMSVPDSLARRLALYVDSGRITAAENEHCGADGWLFVLLGQGLLPRSYDPLVESMPLATAQRALAGISAEMRRRAAALPAHRDFIALCG
ncbi:MAG TPA: tryptophan halogenase family protein, partial [Steroidobacter sp.]